MKNLPIMTYEGQLLLTEVDILNACKKQTFYKQISQLFIS